MLMVLIYLINICGASRTIDLKGLKIYRKPVVIEGKGGTLIDLSKQNEILLVDDDGDSVGYPDLLTYWTQALDIYYSGMYDIYDVATNGDGPDYSVLSNYNVVIWFTGECWNSAYFATLTANDETNLAQYLDNGGKLLLCSQDYFYDRYPSAGSFSSGQFPYDYLGVASVSQDAWAHFGGTLNGSDYPFTGLSGNVYAPYSTNVPFWSDDLTPVSGANTCLFADTAGATANVGVRYETTKGFKTIYTALGFEGLTDVNVRADFIKAALDWFGITSVKEKSNPIQKEIEVKVKINQLIIKLPKEYNDYVKLRVFDISGKKVFEKRVNVTNGFLRITLNNLKSGIYGWELENSEKVWSGKFVVLK